jgi:hypothetical protein
MPRTREYVGADPDAPRRSVEPAVQAAAEAEPLRRRIRRPSHLDIIKDEHPED